MKKFSQFLVEEPEIVSVNRGDQQVYRERQPKRQPLRVEPQAQFRPQLVQRSLDDITDDPGSPPAVAGQDFRATQDDEQARQDEYERLRLISRHGLDDIIPIDDTFLRGKMGNLGFVRNMADPRFREHMLELQTLKNERGPLRTKITSRTNPETGRYEYGRFHQDEEQDSRWDELELDDEDKFDAYQQAIMKLLGMDDNQTTEDAPDSTEIWKRYLGGNKPAEHISGAPQEPNDLIREILADLSPADVLKFSERRLRSPENRQLLKWMSENDIDESLLDQIMDGGYGNDPIIGSRQSYARTGKFEKQEDGPHKFIKFDKPEWIDYQDSIEDLEKKISEYSPDDAMGRTRIRNAKTKIKNHIEARKRLLKSMKTLQGRAGGGKLFEILEKLKDARTNDRIFDPNEEFPNIDTIDDIYQEAITDNMAAELGISPEQGQQLQAALQGGNGFDTMWDELIGAPNPENYRNIPHARAQMERDPENWLATERRSKLAMARRRATKPAKDDVAPLLDYIRRQTDQSFELADAKGLDEDDRAAIEDWQKEFDEMTQQNQEAAAAGEELPYTEEDFKNWYEMTVGGLEPKDSESRFKPNMNMLDPKNFEAAATRAGIREWAGEDESILDQVTALGLNWAEMGQQLDDPREAQQFGKFWLSTLRNPDIAETYFDNLQRDYQGQPQVIERNIVENPDGSINYVESLKNFLQDDAEMSGEGGPESRLNLYGWPEAVEEWMQDQINRHSYNGSRNEYYNDEQDETHQLVDIDDAYDTMYGVTAGVEDITPETHEEYMQELARRMDSRFDDLEEEEAEQRRRREEEEREYGEEGDEDDDLEDGDGFNPELLTGRGSNAQGKNETTKHKIQRQLARAGANAADRARQKAAGRGMDPEDLPDRVVNAYTGVQDAADSKEAEAFPPEEGGWNSRRRPARHTDDFSSFGLTHYSNPNQFGTHRYPTLDADLKRAGLSREDLKSSVYIAWSTGGKADKKEIVDKYKKRFGKDPKANVEDYTKFERRVVALNALKNWKTNVLPTLDPGTIVYNTPIGGGAGGNEREDIYSKAGFGKYSAYGQQGVVGKDGKVYPIGPRTKAEEEAHKKKKGEEHKKRRGDIKEQIEYNEDLAYFCREFPELHREDVRDILESIDS